MGRIFVILFFVVIVGYAFNIFTTYRTHVSIEAPTQSASVFLAADALGADFMQTGTLVFYPNNVGPVPYLFYQDTGGSTVAKALVLPYSSLVDSSWSGAHVSITGQLTDEHVVVSRVMYLSAP